MPPVWIYEHAQLFWQAIGPVPSTFPRHLQTLSQRAFPLTFIRTPTLTLAKIVQRCRMYGILRQDWETADRALQGALIVYNLSGIVFVDSNDSPAEQRFTIAHELAHYLRDCFVPQRKMLERLGPQFADVLAGKRRPTNDERFQGLIRHIDIGLCYHLFDRQEDGQVLNRATQQAENAADALACELLAPAAQVLSELAGLSFMAQCQHLETVYGLPPEIAQSYTEKLCPVRPRSWMRTKFQKKS